MKLSLFGPIAGALLLVAGLGACIDVDMELAVLSKSTVKMTTTMAMDKSFYEMSAASDDGDDGFCEEGEVTLEEDRAICTTIEEASFEEMMSKGSDDEPQPTIVHEGGGKVRVTFPTASLGDDLGGDEMDFGDDEETKQMMMGMFAGHSMTLRISGGKILETNMEIAGDGQSASISIPFTDLFSGNADIPAESFAVVQVR